MLPLSLARKVCGIVLGSISILVFSEQTFSNEFVGRSQCLTCHEQQVTQWTGSHHDQAMQPADDKTVLGDFNDASFTYVNVTSEFYRRDGAYYVRTDGADGKLGEYKVKYTFGVSPLQQYLVEYPNGRLQGLPIAWDTRPQSDGGQRWFHLYPDDKVTHEDPLHWSGPAQNWNFMCSDCHSTALQKNYSTETDSYQTSWSEIDVSCESCHGPGSTHVKWANGGKQDSASKGLAVNLSERAQWAINPQTGLAKRTSPPSAMIQIETCGRCHSRRSVLDQNYRHGKPLLDTHQVQTLQQGLYFPDGQIRDEVYVYGSFLQSKMYKQGVVCSDCHEPHSLKLRAEGNDVCASCHLKSVFDTKEHHYHEADTEGAQCVNCHMTTRTYMVVDDRRDHSFRIPRPDLSEQLGTPDACTSCHLGSTATWAANIIKNQWGGQSFKQPHFGIAIHAAQTGSLDAGKLLVELAQNPQQPGIVRATAATLLQGYLSPAAMEIAQALVKDPDPLVRVNALQIFEGQDIDTRLNIAFDLLNDPVKAVRIEAARLLADTPIDKLNNAQNLQLKTATDEYINGQLINADRAESHVNLGNLYLRMGDLSTAESEYEKAMELSPDFIPAYINLSDLYRSWARDDEGKAILEDGINRFPDSSSLYYAYGLLLVRMKQMDQAQEALQTAVELEPDNSRFRYVYAVALQSAGKDTEALDMLENAHKAFPADQDVLLALINYQQKAGDRLKTRYYAERLYKLTPWNTELQSFLQQLQ